MTIQDILTEFDEKFILEDCNKSKSGKKLMCDPNFAKSFLTTHLTAYGKEQYRLGAQKHAEATRLEKMKHFELGELTTGFNGGINAAITEISELSEKFLASLDEKGEV